MSEPAARRTQFTLFLTLWLGVVVALTASGFDQYFKVATLERGDIAVNALQIDNAGHFRELYGNYSRFEFNHPGPAFFYTYALGEAVFHKLLRLCPSPGNAHLLTSMWLQAAFFCAALTVLCGHFRWAIFAPLAALAAVIQFGPLADPFMSIWPPHVLTMPFLCFLTACSSVAAGRFSHFILATSAGGFLFHGHVAQPLFVGSLGLFALLVAYWRAERRWSWQGAQTFVRTQRKTFVACAAITALFLLPLAIDLIANGARSNLATILGVFMSNKEEGKGLVQSFLYFLSFGTSFREQENLFTTMGPAVGQFFRDHAVAVAIRVAIFATPLIFLRWARKRRQWAEAAHFLAAAEMCLGVAVIGCVLWGIAQAGEMTNFNGYFYYSVYYFALLLSLACVAGLAERLAKPPVIMVLLTLAVVGFTWSFRIPRWNSYETGTPIREGLISALRADTSGRPKILAFEHANWPVAASIALDLQRRGLGYYVAPWWDFMFGENRRLTHLGENPEQAATVWWITEHGTGHAVGEKLFLFTSPAPLEPNGGAINFQGQANAFRYVVAGISSGNVEHAWTDLARVSFLLLPQPATGDVTLVFDAESNATEKAPQPADVFFNGRKIGRVTATQRQALRVVVPRELWNGQPEAKLELFFPDAVTIHTARRPRYEWQAAWALWSIRTESTAP